MPEVKKRKDPLKWTRRCMGGLRDDLKWRLPLYVKDWTDAFYAENRQKTFACTLFLFFACITPAIAFGALFDKYTNGQIGVVETILASALTGIFYALWSGQPLCILGATGPGLAYTVVFFKMCESWEIEFLPAYVWLGLWTAVFTIIIALVDGCAAMWIYTRYAEEIFAALISMIFIVEALKNVFQAYEERSADAALLTTILCLLTYYLATTFKKIKSGVLMNKDMRKLIANFAVTLAVIVGTVVAHFRGHVDIAMLKVPDTLRPSMNEPGTNEARPWILNPFGIERDFPTWAIFATAIPAVGQTILGYLDQNLTALLINAPRNKLEKPPAYHLDLLVCGVFVYPICGILGLPFTYAATVRSLTHLIALTEYKVIPMKGGITRSVPEKVVEQRVTNFMIHLLIGISLFVAGALRVIPMAVLFGVFLFMGVSSMTGNTLFERLHLWLIWEVKNYPKFPFIGHVETWRMHKFTFIQATCLAILYTLKSMKGLSVIFPFFIAALGPIRMYLLPKMFTHEEIEILDAEEGDEEEEEALEKAEEERAAKETKLRSHGMTIELTKETSAKIAQLNEGQTGAALEAEAQMREKQVDRE